MNQEVYQEFDMDLMSIVKKVFTTEIQKPFTFQIMFDPNEIPSGQSHSQYIFEQLLLVFTEGLKVYYQEDQIDITKITPFDFQKIQLYFQSLGFKIDCQVEPILDEAKIQAFLDNPDALPKLIPSDNLQPRYQEVRKSPSGQSKMETSGEELKDYRFTLIKGNERYIITFDHLPHTYGDNCHI